MVVLKKKNYFPTKLSYKQKIYTHEKRDETDLISTVVIIII